VPDTLGASVQGYVSFHRRCALPAVIERGAPLAFRPWATGEKLEKGVWNIPIPQETAEIVTPNILIAPVVGFDRRCYRLGYGGGFFDRTLAVFPYAPTVIGVGYTTAEIPTIHPQWHDIPLSAVVTEKEVVRPSFE